MARQTRANIANTAVRIFLQDFGGAYDDMRGMPRYLRKRDLPEIARFFGDRCCYCGVEFGPEKRPVEDHLVPLNQTGLGLHAWGNIVSSCAECNANKLGQPWTDVSDLAGIRAKPRSKRIRQFVSKYRYDPPFDLASATADLYAETGQVAMALIHTKIERTREASGQSRPSASG